jgi:hypothetical protein
MAGGPQIMLPIWMIPSRIWRRLTAVAFTALAIVVLRPVCEAAEPVALAVAGGTMQAYAGQQDNQGGAEPCCASIDEAPALSPASSVPQSAELFPVARPQLTWQQRALSEHWRALVDSAPPPRGLSYHARSSRLLL